MSWQEYEYETPRPYFRFGPKLTPTVKVLIFINVVVFIATVRSLDRAIEAYATYGAASWLVRLCLVPDFLLRKAFLWQLVSYMFLHAGIFHILLNMFVLWMFGSQVEARLGKKRFLHLYFLSGIGAGLCHAVTSWGSKTPMLGASGAVFGVLVAFAMLFPDRYVTLFLFFIFPVTLKAKHLVLGFALLEIVSVITAARDNVAHFAHLGGLLFGYVYMKYRYRLSLPYAFAERFSSDWKRRWLWRKRPKYKYKPMDAEEFIDREVDPILAKISRHGISSLTRKEKRILKKARSQMK
jgi:membrane associated rhomboid family serine protease